MPTTPTYGRGSKPGACDFPAEVEEYFYDALYRLASVDYADGDTTDYSYDAVGNRTSMTVNGGTALSYSYDNADQMMAAGGVSYGYDDNGNLTSRGGDSFSYDHENRLKTATVAGVLSSDGYNGDGLRMSQTVGAATTDYQWDIARGLPVMVNDEAQDLHIWLRPAEPDADLERRQELLQSRWSWVRHRADEEQRWDGRVVFRIRRLRRVEKRGWRQQLAFHGRAVRPGE